MWFDEEPPYSIYGEGLTRTNKYGQFSILTFTPLMGMSDVVTIGVFRYLSSRWI
ncbi:terminase family protein [Salmonella enterica subsp. enterica serovar Montevideo]|nr:terminase family protein [Salmonella enterica subsp. enterica serovar Montevideo]